MRTLAIPVRGGALELHHWPGQARGGPRVLALPGITANGLSFAPLARALDGRADLYALDLRGRAGSHALPGPYGITGHVRDVRTVLDAVGIDRAVLVGHSMGGFVAANLAAESPGRVDRLVCVDGGYPLPLPGGLDVDAALRAVIGPAMDRLSLTFSSAAEHRQFWQRHPALAAHWSPDVAAHMDHDLIGQPPRLRASTGLQAVREDSAQMLTEAPVREAFLRVRVPTVLLAAARGILDEAVGLYPEQALHQLAAALPHVDLRQVAGTNHYTVLISPLGAGAVAAAVLGDREQSSRSPSRLGGHPPAGDQF